MYDIKFKKLAKVGKYDFPLYWTAWSIILNCAADNGGYVGFDDDYEKEILFELLNINLQEIEDIIQELADVKLINVTPNEIHVRNWGKISACITLYTKGTGTQGKQTDGRGCNLSH